MTMTKPFAARPAFTPVNAAVLRRTVVRLFGQVKTFIVRSGFTGIPDMLLWIVRRIAVSLLMTKITLIGMAEAAGTPAELTTALDANAGTFCTYVDVLPNSKWVKAGALVLFMIGAVILVFGGRGGNTYLMRGLGAVIIIPSIIAIAKAFGMVC